MVIVSIPPTFFLYVQSLTWKSETSIDLLKNIRHYYPALLLMVINLTAYILIYAMEEGELGYDMVVNTMTYSNFAALLFIFVIQNFFYVFRAIVLYTGHRRTIGGCLFL